ncbi:unnamed protein product [Pieris macdunnoughi]|uniref:Uncharacterized protein n=1 Tax=Pieris macdunnoughi TaxID=345717 RepID=A0A821NJE8_9NEOP|nr:unnamed protein product [Pieris macdunnoughi]
MEDNESSCSAIVKYNNRKTERRGLPEFAVEDTKILQNCYIAFRRIESIKCTMDQSYGFQESYTKQINDRKRITLALLKDQKREKAQEDEADMRTSVFTTNEEKQVIVNEPLSYRRKATPYEKVSLGRGCCGQKAYITVERSKSA